MLLRVEVVLKVGVQVKLLVAERLEVCVKVKVLVGVAVGVEVKVAVRVEVTVKLLVDVGLAVAVGVNVLVKVLDGMNVVGVSVAVTTTAAPLRQTLSTRIVPSTFVALMKSRKEKLVTPFKSEVRGILTVFQVPSMDPPPTR